MSDTEQNVEVTAERADGQQHAEQDLQLAELLVGPDGVLTGLTKRVLEVGSRPS